MTELRHDPLADRWTIIAENRGRRPHEFPAGNHENTDPSRCPFCPGHESETPPETFAVRPGLSAPDSPGWEIRVFPNRFPALSPEAGNDPPAEAGSRRMSGRGIHELVVDTPEHHTGFDRLPLDRIEMALRVWQERMQALQTDPRTRYVQVFKNHGEAAGASLLHPHTQILAVPVLPGTVQRELDSFRQHRDGKKACLLCGMLAAEEESGRRLVRAGKDFVAWVPFAARFPYEIRIAPRDHLASFADSGAGERMELARILREILGGLAKRFGDPAFNLYVRTAPNPRTSPAGDPGPFHWHIDILPRLVSIGGFEWSTGIHINPVPPEDAARTLRKDAPAGAATRSRR